MEYTLKLSKSGSAGGERDIPESGISPLQRCPLASKEQGPAGAWGTEQYCLCLPQGFGPHWPCQQVTNILKRVTPLNIASSAALKKSPNQTMALRSYEGRGRQRERKNERMFLRILILLSTQKTRKT